MSLRTVMTRAREIAAFVFAAGIAVQARVAHAGPEGGSVGASLDTKKGVEGSASGSGRELPERVIAGNAISLAVPFQIGAVGYLPKVRIAFQYDRQLHKAHWVYIGAGMLLDHGNWDNFRMDECWPSSDPEDEDPEDKCDKGVVLGFDVYLGYVYKFYLKEHPYLVPLVRLGGGFSWWKYPGLSGAGAREQERDRSWALSLRPGGGLRFFFRDDLGIGADVNLPIGFLVHTDRPLDEGAKERHGGFLLGVEVLLPTLEYRF